MMSYSLMMHTTATIQLGIYPKGQRHFFSVIGPFIGQAKKCTSKDTRFSLTRTEYHPLYLIKKLRSSCMMRMARRSLSNHYNPMHLEPLLVILIFLLAALLDKCLSQVVMELDDIISELKSTSVRSLKLRLIQFART